MTVLSFVLGILIITLLFGTTGQFTHVHPAESTNHSRDIAFPASMNPEISWTYSAGSLFDSDPVAVDLDTDGTMEVLVGCNNRMLYCFSHVGRLEWSYTTNEWILGSPAIADLDHDGDLEIVVGTRANTLYCFDSDGGIEWTFASTGWAWSTACLADINLDGNLEILFATNANMLYCLDNLGEEIWHVNTGNDAEVPPAVGDFDEDGIPDIVIGNHNGRVYCYNSTGHELWNAYAGGGIMNSGFCITDLEVDGHLEIIVGSWDQNVYCFHHNGTERWSFHTGGDIDMSSAAAVDLDDDGTLEVLIGSVDDRLYCIDHNGNQEWYYQTSGNIRASPMVADLDGDGHLDIIVASQNNYLYCLDYTGMFNWSLNLGASPWEDPCITDLDGDGIFEIVISAYSYMHCISMAGVVESGSAPWSCYMGSTHHTGWQDGDSDYLDDFSEDTYYHTSSSDPDSDLDTWLDGIEVFAGTDPNDPADVPMYPSFEIDEIATVPYGVAWAGSVTNGTHIVIFGGENSGGRISSILMYDVEKNISTVNPNQFPSGLVSGNAEYWGGNAYIFGGYDGGYLDTIQIYNVSSGVLSLSDTHLPQPMSDPGSATNGTYIYLFGGFGSSPERKITILGFNPVTEEIVNTGATLPEGLSQTTPVFAGDVVYIFGGHRYGGSAHTYILKYDPSMNTCTQITTTMPREISSMSAVWDGDESIFIFGGALDGYSGDTQYDTIYVFNTTSETIVEHPLTLPVPSIFQMAEYVDGCVYIIGGRTGTSTYLDDVVRFSPYQEKPWPSLKVTRSPLVPSQSQQVQVQVTTLSGIAINQSILSHAYDGVTYTNVSMSNIAGQWAGVIPSYPAYTQVQYMVYVQNIVGEWAVSEMYSYAVVDTEGPVISTTRSPISPIHTESVTINATVIDASDIDPVLLRYSSDNQETWTEVAMGQIGNNWIEVVPLFLGGTNVSYYVRAQDSEGNWGTSDIANYTVNDVQGPSIITMRDLQVPCIDDQVQVTAAVYDTSMVDSVWLMVRFNNASWTNYEMTKISSLYFAYILGQEFGTYVEYKVSANDTVGNWGLSQLETYTVMDFSGPSIVLLTERSSAGQNEVVPVEVDVSDSGGVNQVLLCYSLNSGETYVNISMGQHSGHWSASIPMGIVGESVYYSIYAEDQSGNWELSQLYSYQIIDVIAPNIHITITYDNSNQTETLAVVVEVIDDSEILSVLMRYTIDDWANESEFALDFQDGVWAIQIGFVDSAMTLQYRIVVEDTAHNIYESGIMFYTIVHSPYQAPPLDFALVVATSGGIGVVIIFIILYVRKKQG
jgi:hypothetical protein